MMMNFTYDKEAAKKNSRIVCLDVAVEKNRSTCTLIISYLNR